MAEAAAKEEQKGGEIAVFKPPRLAYHKGLEEAVGLDRSTWRVLVETIWPGAQSVDMVVNAWNYCKARKLDPLKRVVHIVPVWDNKLRRNVETIWPGVAELRTTAVRTGVYLGIKSVEYGPMKVFEYTVASGDDRDEEGNAAKAAPKFRLEAPEWIAINIVKMLVLRHGDGTIFQAVEHLWPGPRTFFSETVALMKGKPNSMWSKRPAGQLEKCAEAAALRRAFPDEIGADWTAEEMEGQDYHTGPTIDHDPAENRRASAAKQFQDFAETGNHKPEREAKTVSETITPGGSTGPTVAERRAAKAAKPQAEDVSWVDEMRLKMEAANDEKAVSIIWAAYSDRYHGASEMTQGIASSVFDECLSVFDSSEPEGGADDSQ